MKKIVFLISMAMALASCVKEDRDDCNINVSFRYDYNMLSADAFASQADELTLYVFDENDLLVRKYDRKTVDMGSSMTVEELPQGRYRFVAWGRSDEPANANFAIPVMTVGESRIGELQYRLPTDMGVQKDELNHFLVGVQQADISAKTSASLTVSLKKVTKKIRVVLLPYTAGTQIDADDYSFRIEDPVGNGVVSYDYSLLPGDPVTYRPYYTANITPAPGSIPTGGEIDRAVVAEIATSRLMEAHAPRLYITDRSGSRLFADINLPWLFSLTGMESHREWTLQEYLDRQDEFIVMLFFQDETWMNATIIINGWVVNDIDIGR